MIPACMCVYVHMCVCLQRNILVLSDLYDLFIFFNGRVFILSKVRSWNKFDEFFLNGNMGSVVGLHIRSSFSM